MDDNYIIIIYLDQNSKNKFEFACSGGYQRNFGIDRSTGGCIALCDDDIWFPKKLESIINLSRKHKNKFVFYNNTEYCNSDLKPTGKFKF